MKRAVHAVAALLAFALAACRPAPEGAPPPEPEIVDVGPAIDAEIDLSTDVQGVLPSEALGGVLPGDFPAEFPVYSPASLIDFGREGATAWVVLLSPDPVATVRAGQLERLRRAGWEVGERGSGATVRRGGRSAGLSFRDAGGGTEIRVDY